MAYKVIYTQLGFIDSVFNEICETRSDALLSHKNYFLNLHLWLNTDALYSNIIKVRVTIPSLLICQKYLKTSKTKKIHSTNGRNACL